MVLKKGLIFFFLLITSFGFSQSGINLKLGASPWHIIDNYEDISNPINVGYSAGLNYEMILGFNFGLVTGLEYLYASPGVAYMDLTDQEDLVTQLYTERMNEKFIQITHHEFTIPLMLIFYHNGLRSAIGGSISRYFFADPINTGQFNTYNDFGLKAITGARISKRMIFSLGYYYGLNDFVQFETSKEISADALPLNGSMHQIKIHLAFSLFNNLEYNRFYLTP